MNQFINKVRNIMLIMLAVFLIATLPIVVVSAFIAMLTPIGFFDITSHPSFWIIWVITIVVVILATVEDLQSYLD